MIKALQWTLFMYACALDSIFAELFMPVSTRIFLDIFVGLSDFFFLLYIIFGSKIRDWVMNFLILTEIFFFLNISVFASETLEFLKSKSLDRMFGIQSKRNYKKILQVVWIEKKFLLKSEIIRSRRKLTGPVYSSARRIADLWRSVKFFPFPRPRINPVICISLSLSLYSSYPTHPFHPSKKCW